MVSNLRRRLSRLRDDVFAFGERGRDVTLKWLRYTPPPALSPEVRIDQLRSRSRLLDNAALTVFTTSCIVPLFGGTPRLNWFSISAGVLIAAVMLVASQRLLRYIANHETGKDSDDA